MFCHDGSSLPVFGAYSISWVKVYRRLHAIHSSGIGVPDLDQTAAECILNEWNNMRCTYFISTSKSCEQLLGYSAVGSDNVSTCHVIPASKLHSAVQFWRERSKSGAGLQSTVHAMSDLWIVPKQEEVDTKSKFLQIIMPSSTSRLVNWKEAEQVTPQTMPSLPSDFILYPDLSSLFQYI